MKMEGWLHKCLLVQSITSVFAGLNLSPCFCPHSKAISMPIVGHWELVPVLFLSWTGTHHRWILWPRQPYCYQKRIIAHIPCHSAQFLVGQLVLVSYNMWHLCILWLCIFPWGMVRTILETTQVRLSPCMLLWHDQVVYYLKLPQCPEEPQPRSPFWGPRTPTHQWHWGLLC